MGKFKTIFAACLSLGVVAGAGYYVYRKFARKYEEKKDDNLTQGINENENNSGENDKVIDKDDSNSTAVSRVDSMKVVPPKEENQSAVVTSAVAKGGDKSTNATNKQKDPIKNDKIMDVNRNIKNKSSNTTVPKIDSMKIVPLKEKENQCPVDEPAAKKRKGKRTAARKKDEPPKKTAKKEKSNFGGLKKGFLL